MKDPIYFLIFFVFVVFPGNISFVNSQEVPLADEVTTEIKVRTRSKVIKYSLVQLQTQIRRADKMAEKFEKKERQNRKWKRVWEARAKSLRDLLPVVEKKANKIYKKERR